MEAGWWEQFWLSQEKKEEGGNQSEYQTSGYQTSDYEVSEYKSIYDK